MAHDWFFTRDGKSKHGPYSAAQLQAYAKSGQLLPTDMVLMKDTTKWTPASALTWLFPKSQAVTASPPLPVATILPEAVPVAKAVPALDPSVDWNFWHHSPKLRATVLCIVTAVLLIALGARVTYIFTKQPKTRTQPVANVPAVVQPAPQAPVGGKAAVTKAMYDRIKDGMTYQQVVGITGAHGEEIAGVGVEGKELTMYVWENADESHLVLGFHQGRVKVKTQVGLR